MSTNLFDVLKQLDRNGIAIASDVIAGKVRGATLQAAAAQRAALEDSEVTGVKQPVFPKGYKKNEQETSWNVAVTQGRTAVKLFHVLTKEGKLDANHAGFMNMWRTGNQDALSPQAFSRFYRSQAEILTAKLNAAVKLISSLRDDEQYEEVMARIAKNHAIRQGDVEIDIDAVSLVS